MSTWRAQVRKLPDAETLDTPTLNDHVPELLVELRSALFAGDYDSILDMEVTHSAKQHGLQRLRSGFDIIEVVAEYNILRELLQALAEQAALDATGALNRILNRVIDRGVAVAVDTYARERALEIQKKRGAVVLRGPRPGDAVDGDEHLASAFDENPAGRR